MTERHHHYLAVLFRSLCLLASSVVITPAFGTTFVALSTDRAVALGIDTKQGHQRNGRIISVSTVCKVVTRPNAAYGISGATGITGVEDIYPVIDATATDDIDVTLRSIEGPIKTFLDRYLPTASAADLRPYVRNGKPITVIVGIGFKRRGVMRDLSFYVDKNRMIRSEVTLYANPGATFTQVNGEITKALPQNWSAATDLASLVGKLLDTGIGADPESDYPVSIVSIDQFGVRKPVWPKICN